MMKLKYLFDNKDLALMLLKNWEHDDNYLDMFKYYRISSNAVYPFKSQAKTQLLRFAPLSEKKLKDVKAELDYIRFLKENNFPCLSIVSSNQGNELEVKDTPWGKFIVCVFSRVQGNSLDDTEMELSHITLIGKTLAQMHLLSRKYTVALDRRKNHTEILNEMKEVFLKSSQDVKILSIIENMSKEFDKLPKNVENYGLIHYDFELDNLFYEQESQQLSVIDFDDSMYHWYVMDINQCLENLYAEVENIDNIIIKEEFLKAYQSISLIDTSILEFLPLFNQFGMMYQLARVIESLKEKWDHEPEWMCDLRYHLQQRINLILKKLNI